MGGGEQEMSGTDRLFVYSYHIWIDIQVAKQQIHTTLVIVSPATT